MSLLEWFLERRNPGPIGSVDVEPEPPYAGRPIVTVLRAMVAIVVVGGLGVLAYRSEDPMVALLFLALYLLIGYLMRVVPDMSNTGLLGFIDHPFRWSDDANRFLVGLQVAFFPARFSVFALRDAIALARGRRAIVLRRKVSDQPE